ncbi:MAG TPA: FecR family protein [Steroidobacteraceae bacterium]|nr:FecR family protein [Steroidobacteraceae bacterium]
MHIRTKPDVITEASRWFIEFRTGDVTESDRARFDEWLRRSPEHIQTYIEIAAGWAELPTSDPARCLDIPLLVQRAKQSHDENVVTLSAAPLARPAQRRTPLRTWTVLFAAASLAIVFALGIYFFEAGTYRTGVGEQRTVELADGTTIEMNALSTIRVRLSKSLRKVYLTDGQALFHVAKDPSRPFIVYSDGMTVRAVGTQFDVYRRSSGTTVTVLEGQVAVSAPSAATDGTAPTTALSFLTAGDQITIPSDRSQKKAVKPKPADVVAATAWVQKRLVFEETPLWAVAQEFNRYNTRRLVIAEPDLRSLEISGVYSSNDPDSLLDFLRTQPNIQLTVSDKEIRVTSRGKK